MELTIAPEHRSIIDKLKDIVTDVPSNTPPHIRTRLQAGITAVCEKRAVSTFEELVYQEQAKHFQALRPQVIVKRTAAPVKREPKSLTAADVRSTLTAEDRRCGVLALHYRHLSYDQIRRAVRLNYGTDTINAMNLAEIGKKLGK
jgi:hypothetical protein